LFNKDALQDLDVQLAKLAEADLQLSKTIGEGLGNPDQIRGLMRQKKAERERLEDERLSLLSVAAQSSALDDFKKLMKQLLEGKIDPDESEIDEVFEQGFKAWDALPMEARRSIIRGGYRVQLLEGGRGPERILVTAKSPAS
jgi:hypothetical protein